MNIHAKIQNIYISPSHHNPLLPHLQNIHTPKNNKNVNNNNNQLRNVHH